MAETQAARTDRPYAGLLGAFPYAFRQSDSYLLKGYALVSALVGIVVVTFLALGLVAWLGNPTGLVGERALLGVIGIFLLVPLFAPVLLVARRHRRAGSALRYDRALALAGFAFAASIYLGLVVTVPPQWQEPSTSPLVAFLYALPPTWGFAPPVVGVALIVLAHRFAR